MSKDMLYKPRMFLDGERLLDSDCKYNQRLKYIPDGKGGYALAEIMTCNRFIFNPENVAEFNKDLRLHREAWERQLEEMYDLRHVERPKASKEDNAARSKRRAKKHMFDLILCNRFTHFCTLTLNPAEIDRGDYDAVIRKVNTYLDNRVRRNGLCYVGVPELHKKGGLHFHFLVNDSLPLVPSGTVIRPSGGRPVKEATALRQGFALEECKPVYNIRDWSLGFTTAIETYGDVKAVANYVGKYITKSEKKVGGRWYYHGGKLDTPHYEYKRVSFGDVVGDYGFICDGGAFLVQTF